MDKKFFWRLTLLVVTIGYSVSPAWAGAASAPAPAATNRPSGGLTLTTSPLPVTLNAKPGQTITTTLKIKQSSDGPATLQTTLLKFAAYGTNGKPALSHQGPGDFYFSWVSFDKTNFVAPNNVWQNVKMTIKIPTTAANEYNYAVEFTRQGDATYPGGESEALSGGTAILVLLNVVTPNENRSLKLDSFSVKNSIVEFVPTTFEVAFHNNGNVYIQPSGEIFITQGDNQVADIAINDQQGNILAGSHRIFPVEWTDGWPFYTPALTKTGKAEVDRHGHMKTILSFGLPSPNGLNDGTDSSVTNGDISKEGSNPLNRFRFGEYTARLVAVYTDDFGDDVPITSQITFWVVPWRILILFLVILGIIGFAIYTIIRNIMRRRRRIKRLMRKRREMY
jgi:hypothetical protein